MRDSAYVIAQTVWGFPQTLVGLAVLLAHRGRPRFRYHGAIVTTWNSHKALSSGPFVFMNGSGDTQTAKQSVDESLLVHEYGHTIQSLILGPMYLPTIGLPSVIWLNFPGFKHWRRRTGTSYYSFFTERSANHLAERVLNRPAIGSISGKSVVCRLLVSRLRLRGAGFSPPERTQHHPEPVAFYTMRVTPPYRASPRWPPRCRSWPSPSRRPGWAAGRPRTSPRP